MYYKTKKDTETGQKFQKIALKSENAFEDQKRLADKYGFKKWRPAYWSVWGGFSSCADFENTPDRKIWGKGAEKNEYMPKRNSLAGKAIDKEFEEMTIVSNRELNKCIGFNNSFSKTIGFSYNNDEYFGFSVVEEWNVKVPSDCEEITTTEWNKLFNN